MSPGQTGRTPGGVPPKFFMFIGFFLSPLKLLQESDKEKQLATAGRSHGGPSEKFVGGFGGLFQKLRPNFSEVAFIWKSPDATHLGATS